MAGTELKVEKRDKKSKSYAKNLRKEGRILGNYYTQGKESIPISIDSHDFLSMIAHDVNFFELNFGKGKNKPSIIKELQYDPVRGDIVHIDMMGVKVSEKIVVSVPTNLVGSPVGVEEEGGILEHSTREIEVECLPTNIPSSIDVDVSHLELNESVHAKDLELGDIDLISDEEIEIAHVVPSKLEEEIAAEEEMLEEEAEEAEPEVISKEKEEEEEEEKGKESEEE